MYGPGSSDASHNPILGFDLCPDQTDYNTTRVCEQLIPPLRYDTLISNPLVYISRVPKAPKTERKCGTDTSDTRAIKIRLMASLKHNSKVKRSRRFEAPDPPLPQVCPRISMRHPFVQLYRFTSPQKPRGRGGELNVPNDSDGTLNHSKAPTISLQGLSTPLQYSS